MTYLASYPEKRILMGGDCSIWVGLRCSYRYRLPFSLFTLSLSYLISFPPFTLLTLNLVTPYPSDGTAVGSELPPVEARQYYLLE